VTPRGGALFPLTPWAAHVMFGAAFARPLLSSHARASRTAIAAAALIAAGTSLPASLAPIPDHLTRLGCVLASLSLLTLLERAARRLPAWAWELSSETLFIYASHVLFVYGQGVGLAALVGPSYAPLPSVLLATGMIALSFGGALLYRRFSAGLARGTATG
jgi:hypothetical protein